MQVVLIGAGNVASSLGVAVERVGHDVLQVYSRTKESASTLAQTLHCDYITDFNDLTDKADVYFVCLPDDVIKASASQITDGRENLFFVHTAGSVPVDVLPCKRRGVMWPTQSFSKNNVIECWNDIPLFIETSDKDRDILKTFAESLSKKVFYSDSDMRKRVHLAAVFCNNFSNHCYSLAEELLKEVNVPFEVMLPMIEAATEKVGKMSPKLAQTGPAARGDKKTVGEHLKLLGEKPRLREVYEIMSKSIAYDKL